MLEKSSILMRGEGGEADWAMEGSGGRQSHNKARQFFEFEAMLENSSNSKNLGGEVGRARQSHDNARKFFEFEEFGGRGGRQAEP